MISRKFNSIKIYINKLSLKSKWEWEVSCAIQSEKLVKLHLFLWKKLFKYLNFWPQIREV